jgi:hypothetical protein
MRFTVAISIYIHTPGTILRLSELFDGDDSGESCHDDKQKPHGPLLVVPPLWMATLMLSNRTTVGHLSAQPENQNRSQDERFEKRAANDCRRRAAVCCKSSKAAQRAR